MYTKLVKITFEFCEACIGRAHGLVSIMKNDIIPMTTKTISELVRFMLCKQRYQKVQEEIKRLQREGMNLKRQMTGYKAK